MKTNPNDLIEYNGTLTKREYFAAMAMQGFIASGFGKTISNIDSNGNGKVEISLDQISNGAVKMADVLINELNKESEK